MNEPQMDLGFCEVCMALDPPMVTEARAILHAGDEQLRLCNPHCTAMVAPAVLMSMQLHMDHLVRRHGMSEEDAAIVVSIMAAAIEDGNWQVFLTPACHIAADMAMLAGSDADIIHRIQNGTIMPEDFMDGDDG